MSKKLLLLNNIKYLSGCCIQPVLLAISFLLGLATGLSAAEPYQNPKLDPAVRAADLLGRMTLEEKISYLGGERFLYIRGIPRLSLPEIRMADGAMGVRGGGKSTSFGGGIAFAASWDPDLVRSAAEAIGKECRTKGVHILLAPGVNINRSPLCGRNFEYHGEDPFLAGKMAVAEILGLKEQGVLATVKHFACNNQEWERHWVSSEVDERTLREIYLPAFKAAVQEGGVAAVMTGYNPLNGTHCAHNDWLLNQLLKKEWGFKGFVMSDWHAVHDTKGAALGGCDLEMPGAHYMNLRNLKPLIESGAVPAAVIDDKVRRILTTIIGAGFLDRPQIQDAEKEKEVLAASAEVSLKAARAGMVLLKNEGGVLPINPETCQKILVVGPNGKTAVVGGFGSSGVGGWRQTSVLKGLTAAAPKSTVTAHPGLQAISEYVYLNEPAFKNPARLEWFANGDLTGAPVATGTANAVSISKAALEKVKGIAPDQFSVRWTGAVEIPSAGSYLFAIRTTSRMRVLVDGKSILEDAGKHNINTSIAHCDLTGGKHDVVVEYAQNGKEISGAFGFGSAAAGANDFVGREELLEQAKSADLVVACLGFSQSYPTQNSPRLPFGESFYAKDWPDIITRLASTKEGEAYDRTFALHPAQVETVRAIASVNKKIVVVLNCGGGVHPAGWADLAPAILCAWYPGQEGGTAVAEILTGAVNPSGKLPVTFAKKYDDYPSAPYYSIDANNIYNVDQSGERSKTTLYNEQYIRKYENPPLGKTLYAEGINVGYRGFDAGKIEPWFPFGYGLSYTTFGYEGLKVSSSADGTVNVSFTIKNTGKRAGAEVAQVYVAPAPAPVPRPPKELKGFTKVSLAPGESKNVSITLPADAFAYWNPESKAWTTEKGKHGILVGASSRDIRLNGEVTR